MGSVGCSWLTTAVIVVLTVQGGAGPADMVGSWRIYSERIFYDRGGAGALGTPVSRVLEIKGNGEWEFGESRGTWRVEPIAAGDWKRWSTQPYGPRRKIVLEGWAKGPADGPVEESSRVDFVWVIYRVAPPSVRAEGMVQMKFGRVRP